ncbi:WD40/YVTN/BNR-like repeat-containing protein [Halobacterium yunchengense]|uniref:WD40/YVTN/BNR-like repeat-containing protein n=1 Tax=Halobacterium yunchengense TaxID=3108497 RepID=UPI0030099C7B
MRLLAAFPDRVLAVGDDGGVRATFEGDVQCLASGEYGTYCGTSDGVYRSTDAGREWHHVADVGDVTAVAVHGSGAWAGTEPSAVYRAADGESFAECEGLTDLPSSGDWAFPPRPSTHHVRWLEPTDDRLYVAVEAGALVRSPDRGETWQDRVPSGPYDTHSMATHAGRPDLAYAAAGDGFYVTEDGGESWRTEADGLDRTYCWSVARDPGDPERALASAAQGPRSAHDAGSADSAVFRRDGLGERWERCDGLPGPEGLLAPSLAAVDPGGAVAVTNRGCYRTDDWGASWRRVDDGWPAALASERPRGATVP